MTFLGRINITRSSQPSTGSSWQFDNVLAELCSAYASTGQPIEVDFRKLVPVRSGSDRSTHLVHSYPAKLLPNIPIFFANCRSLAEPGSLIYDPFCGTGTVLVEGLLAGQRVAGADANPLARLIARVKTTRLELEHAREVVRSVADSAGSEIAAEFQPVVDVDKWFSPQVKLQLGRLRSAIEKVEVPEHRQFALVALSQTVKKVSLADPRMSVPVRYKGADRELPDVFTSFQRIALANAQRVADLPIDSRPVFIERDARQPICAGGSDLLANLVITSPPYAGAQKYIRASSLSLGWLGIVPEGRLRSLEMLNIGREHLSRFERSAPHDGNLEIAEEILRRITQINALRADILRTYLQEMRVAVQATSASLAYNGHLVLVMGDNQVCGFPVRTSDYIKRFFEDEGLVLRCELVDTIKSRGLMTKRNRTAGLITQERVFVFRKMP